MLLMYLKLNYLTSSLLDGKISIICGYSARESLIEAAHKLNSIPIAREIAQFIFATSLESQTEASERLKGEIKAENDVKITDNASMNCRSIAGRLRDA